MSEQQLQQHQMQADRQDKKDRYLEQPRVQEWVNNRIDELFAERYLSDFDHFIDALVDPVPPAKTEDEREIFSNHANRMECKEEMRSLVEQNYRAKNSAAVGVSITKMFDNYFADLKEKKMTDLRAEAEQEALGLE